MLSTAGKCLDRKVIGRVLHRQSKILGVHDHPHLLRHSLAVHLLRREVYSSLDTAKVYLRLVPGHLREDYDRAILPVPVEASPTVE